MTLTLPAQDHTGSGTLVMPKLSSKRQITLPKTICEKAGLEPGDEFKILEYHGQITLVRQRRGAARGFLRSLTADPDFSETESRDSAISNSGSDNDSD